MRKGAHVQCEATKTFRVIPDYGCHLLISVFTLFFFLHHYTTQHNSTPHYTTTLHYTTGGCTCKNTAAPTAKERSPLCQECRWECVWCSTTVETRWWAPSSTPATQVRGVFVCGIDLCCASIVLWCIVPIFIAVCVFSIVICWLSNLCESVLGRHSLFLHTKTTIITTTLHSTTSYSASDH